MLFYSFLFVLFILLYYIAEKSNRSILVIFSAIPPTLLEGLRDWYVGSDMLGYGSQWFEGTNIQDSITQVIETAPTPEYGFILLIYFCKLMSKDINMYMTVCAFIKILLVYFACFNLRKKLNTIILLFAYYCFFYVLGFSMMRQSIAIAICFYSLFFLLNHRLKSFLSMVLLAYFFHNSAVLMLIFVPLYYMREMKLKYIIIIGSGLLVLYWIELLFSFVLKTPIFKSEMADLYLDSGVASAKTNILEASFFLLYSFLLNFKRVRTNDEKVYYLIVSSFLTLVFLLLSSYIEVAFRMSYYMFIMSMMLSAYYISNSRHYRGLLTVGYIALFLLHSYIESTHGMADALPYSSKILGI